MVFRIAQEQFRSLGLLADIDLSQRPSGEAPIARPVRVENASVALQVCEGHRGAVFLEIPGRRDKQTPARRKPSGNEAAVTDRSISQNGVESSGYGIDEAVVEFEREVDLGVGAGRTFPWSLCRPTPERTGCGLIDIRRA